MLLGGALAAVAACTGAIDAEATGGAATSGTTGTGMVSGTGTPTGSTTGSDMPVTPTPGEVPNGVVGKDGVPLLRARAWRLTHAQYFASVRALLGFDPSLPAPPADAEGYYRNQSAILQVPLATAKYYFESAESIARSMTESQLLALVPCGQLGACVDDFILALTERAFRRPVSDEERTRYRGVFDLAASSTDTTYPYRAVVQALLNAPYFLYRTEIGAPDERTASLFTLTDHEIVSFLSYSLLGGPPSQALLDAAARGGLAEPSGLAGAVVALLADPNAVTGLRTFLTDWLHIPDMRLVDKDAELFTGYDETIQTAMQLEAQRFIEQVGVMQGGARALVTDPVPSVGAELDAFYRGDPSGAVGGERLGGLALGSVLAEHGRFNLSSPVLRGVFVRNRILCQVISSPPDGVNTSIEAPTALGEVRTTRQSFEAHTSEAVCHECHQYLDTLGFPFESFDGAGRFRTVENGVPVDTSGELVGTDVDRPVANYQELVLALAESGNYSDCVALQGYRYFFGQMEPELQTSPQAVTAAREALRATGTLQGMLEALLSADVNVLPRQR